MRRTQGRVLAVLVALGTAGCGSVLGFDDVTIDGEDAAAGSSGDGGQGGTTPDGGGGQAGGGAGGASGAGGSSGGGGSSGSSGAGGSAGSSGAGGSGGSAGAGGAGGAAGAGGSSGAGGGGGCDPNACGPHEHCQGTACVCDGGYVPNGNACEAAPPGDPATHTQADVCQRWSDGHAVTDSKPFTAGANQCDPGTLSAGGIQDTLTRINMFRWMVGLGPTDHDPTSDQGDQACAVIAAWNPAGSNAHNPPPTATCYSSLGAQWAGQSNIAWGSGAAASIDQFIEDQGNATTMGHRRWILHPPLGPVGIGYYEGGNQYGKSECLGVFASSGNGPSPKWYAFPPPGFSPTTVTGWTWTFHTTLSGIGAAQIQVVRLSDSAPMSVKVQKLSQGYGDDCISWDPSGWTPTAGETYRVTVTGVGSAAIEYDVSPVNCP